MSKIHINPKSGIKLTRAQRRQVLKNARRIDHVTDTDRRFFQRFPQRSYRVRLAGQAEVDQADMLEGAKSALPPGFQWFMAIKQINLGHRHRLLMAIRKGSVFDDIDMTEEKARELWETTATPQSRKIEDVMIGLENRRSRDGQ